MIEGFLFFSFSFFFFFFLMLNSSPILFTHSSPHAMVCSYALAVSNTKINPPVVKHENFMPTGKTPFPSCAHLNLYVQASKTDQSARNTNIPRMGLLRASGSSAQLQDSEGEVGELPLTLIYIKADELLYTLPVLQLGRAVAGILTWLSKGALCFSHLLVHSSQTQPRVEQRKSTREKVIPSLIYRQRFCIQALESPGGTYKVTMSALAAWTAILSGSCPSPSTAC